MWQKTQVMDIGVKFDNTDQATIEKITLEKKEIENSQSSVMKILIVSKM